MNLIIYTNEEYEDEKALFDLDSNKMLLKGDYYHNKISEKIEGYLNALNDFEIYCEEVNRESIDRNHELFELIGFYYE